MQHKIMVQRGTTTLKAGGWMLPALYWFPGGSTSYILGQAKIHSALIILSFVE